MSILGFYTPTYIDNTLLLNKIMNYKIYFYKVEQNGGIMVQSDLLHVANVYLFLGQQFITSFILV